jgi:hypothetical protein
MNIALRASNGRVGIGLCLGRTYLANRAKLRGELPGHNLKESNYD